MVTVKVISSNTGKPVKGRRVIIGFEGLMSGGMSDEGFTDSSGEVHFNNDPGRGKVYVDHKAVYDGKIEGRVVVYV